MTLAAGIAAASPHPDGMCVACAYIGGGLEAIARPRATIALRIVTSGAAIKKTLHCAYQFIFK
jgi:hypothetical protein